MSIIYEKQLSLAKRDTIHECAWTQSQWDEAMRLTLVTVRDLGFRDNYDVNRVAKRFGTFK